MTFIPVAELPPLTIEPMTCCLGLEPEPWAFVGHLVLVFREVRRVLRGDATCWLNLGDSYAGSGKGRNADGRCQAGGKQGTNRGSIEGLLTKTTVDALKPKDLCMIPARVALALQADGWWLRSDIIWHKVNPMPEPVTDRPTSAHEHVFLLTKSARYFYDAEAVREAVAESSIERAKYSLNSNNSGFVRDARTGSSFEKTRNGETMGEAGFVNPAGRNRRNVWTIASESFKEAHFATFPRKLVEPCILAGTSARGVCECGAPWARVVERTAMEINRTNNHPPELRTRTSGTMTKPPTSTTTGWRPTCDCPPADPRPALVLDPFFGSGTVGAVAVETGRHYLGIELNPDYIELARRRIGAAQPALFARGL